MKNAFNTFVRWVVLSSQDPAEVSLTIKGVLVGLVPYIMVAVGLAHLNLGQDQLTGLFDTIAGLVQAVLALVAIAMTAYGMLRKLATTIRVHQQVINQPLV